MARRIAACTALLVFAVCLLVGGLQAGNSFGTTVGRALIGMFATLFIGLAVGAMGQKMLDESVGSVENGQPGVPGGGLQEKSSNSEAE